IERRLYSRSKEVCHMHPRNLGLQTIMLLVLITGMSIPAEGSLIVDQTPSTPNAFFDSDAVDGFIAADDFSLGDAKINSTDTVKLTWWGAYATDNNHDSTAFQIRFYTNETFLEMSLPADEPFYFTNPHSVTRNF